MSGIKDLLAKNGIKLESTAPGRYYTTCPQCSALRSSNAHRTAKVLGITIENDGSVCFGCNHCDLTGPKKGDGKRSNTFAATYDYRDKDGALLFQKVRNLPGSSSRFLCRRLEGGTWVWGLSKKIERPLYRLPEIIEAIKEGRTILVVEGEKDADACWRIGFPATCNFDGAGEAGKNKWRREYSETFRDADIIVLNDNDSAGYAHADTATRMSLGIAKRVRRLDLAPHWPNMPKGADISDWLALGHTRAELDALVEAAPDYVPPKGKQTQEEKPDEPIAANAEIERLAKLEPFQYEQERKAAGERLDVRAGILDKLVKAERDRLGLNDGDNKQGHAIEFPAIEPWPHPVDGAPLLNDVADTIRSHVVMSNAGRDICALWVTHTFLVTRFAISPKLSIRSIVKGCGKSTLLDVLNHLVARPLLTGNISAAALFRVIASHHPSLLIDEVDTFVGDNEDLRGMLNASHRHDGYVTRTVGESFEPRRFSVYAATALAGIGKLVDTLADRSIILELKRRTLHEPIAQLRIGRTGHLDELQRRIARFVADHGERIGEIEPVMPAGIVNREADNWAPLLSIANVAGGEWPERARKAAEAAHNTAAASDDIGRLELLLADVRDIFAGLMMDRIASADLVAALIAVEGRPWAEYGRSGKPLTQNKLARMLKPLGITPENMRVGDEVPKGYVLSRFEEVFARYLPYGGASEPLHRYKADETGTSEPVQTATPGSDVADRKCEKSANGGHCSDVADVKRGNGGDTQPHLSEPGFGAASEYELLGPASPGERCSLCGNGSPDLIRHRSEINLWHRACADRYLAALADPPIKIPDMPPDTIDEHGGPKETTSGLSEGRIRELGQLCLERAEAQRRANGGETDQAEIEEGLRIILREEVFQFVEIELERVMQRVFAV